NLTSMAKQIGMSFQRFDHHIKPKNNLSLNVARQLADHLGMKLEDFIKAVEVKETNSTDEFDNQPFGD
ncbi:MAG TPA: hypothetical protein DCM40_43850, partial [Maribacter sp.]|nr:hypothetical protein [Maribacter sp.]